MLMIMLMIKFGLMWTHARMHASKIIQSLEKKNFKNVIKPDDDN